MTIPSGGRIPFLPAGCPDQPERDHLRLQVHVWNQVIPVPFMTDRGLSHERNQDRAGNLGEFLNSSCPERIPPPGIYYLVIVSIRILGFIQTVNHCEFHFIHGNNRFF